MLVGLLSHLRLGWGKSSSKLIHWLVEFSFLCSFGLRASGSRCLLAGVCLQFLAVWSLPTWPLTFSKTLKERVSSQDSGTVFYIITVEMTSITFPVFSWLKRSHMSWVKGKGPQKGRDSRKLCHESHLRVCPLQTVSWWRVHSVESNLDAWLCILALPVPEYGSFSEPSFLCQYNGDNTYLQFIVLWRVSDTQRTLSYWLIFSVSS